jgi:hypothetical protein
MKPATDEQLEAWRFETVRAANAKYGVDEAKERIAKLNAYLRADPRLKGQLEVGVGSHPRVVAMLLEKAHQLRCDCRRDRRSERATAAPGPAGGEDAGRH